MVDFIPIPMVIHGTHVIPGFPIPMHISSSYWTQLTPVVLYAPGLYLTGGQGGLTNTALRCPFI